MNKEQRKAAELAIASQINAWLDKTPEEKAAAIRQEQARADEREAEAMKVSEGFQKVMAGLLELQGRMKVMTKAQEEEYVWRTQIEPAMAAAGITERHRVRLTDWKCKPQYKVFTHVKNLCIGKGAVVALVGHRGTGKTTIPAQIMRERIEAEHEWYMADSETRKTMTPPREPGRYIKLLRLGAAFKPLYAEFGSINAGELADLLSRWVMLPLLVIDEVHEVDDMRTHDRLLVDVIDRRYARKKDTIIIDNRSISEFRDKTNPSILSRISEHGAVIPCEWPSFRQPKQ